MRGLSRARSRASDLGRIGNFLLACLPQQAEFEHPNHLEDQMVVCEKYFKAGNKMKAIAVSILLNDVSLQMELNSYDIMTLVDNSLEPLPKERSRRLKLDEEHKYKYFKVKPYTAASEKSNVWFTEAWKELVKISTPIANKFRMLSDYMIGFSNDQAACCLIFCMAIRKVVEDPVEMAIRVVRDPVGCKSLTTILKGLGANCTEVGSLFCEAQALQGRGEGIPDMRSKCKERIGRLGTSSCPQQFDEDLLRRAIRVVLDEEMDMSKYRCPDMDKFWSKRWLWCVNGSHSRVLERHEPKLAIDFAGQAHRRVAMEHWRDNPIIGWDGITYVSASVKLETGKTRLILACDSRSYVAFSHLLSGVENCWRNSRTILDPGAMGFIGLQERVTALEGEIYVMMDYDDFNSQHTLLSQQLVISETCDKVGYPEELARVLIRSFERMLITVEGEDVGYASATLMSGHRGTTYINSILNSAYVYCSAPHLWNKFSSIHTGDDVVAKFNSYSDINELFACLREFGIRMNPMKQSVGKVCAEFLRVAITPAYCVGYVCRAISTSVAGNWGSDKSLPAVEFVTSIVSSVRSVINRCRDIGIADMYISSAQRMLSMKRTEIRNVLRGSTAVGDGPVYYDGGNVWRGVKLKPQPKEDLMKGKVLSAVATNDYLQKNVKPIERIVLERYGFSVTRVMTEASYAKSLSSRAEGVSRVRAEYGELTRRILSKHIYGKDLFKYKVKEGLLNKYPLLHLIKDHLDYDALREIITGMGYTPAKDLRAQAWGASSAGIIIWGWLPFSEAAAAAKRVGGCILEPLKPIYM